MSTHNIFYADLEKIIIKLPYISPKQVLYYHNDPTYSERQATNFL